MPYICAHEWQGKARPGVRAFGLLLVADINNGRDSSARSSTAHGIVFGVDLMFKFLSSAHVFRYSRTRASSAPSGGARTCSGESCTCHLWALTPQLRTPESPTVGLSHNRTGHDFALIQVLRSLCAARETHNASVSEILDFNYAHYDNYDHLPRVLRPLYVLTEPRDHYEEGLPRVCRLTRLLGLCEMVAQPISIYQSPDNNS